MKGRIRSVTDLNDMYGTGTLDNSQGNEVKLFQGATEGLTKGVLCEALNNEDVGTKAEADRVGQCGEHPLG